LDPDAIWQAFAAAVPWCDDATLHGVQEPGSWSPCDAEFGEMFPNLDALLRRAAVLRVHIGRRRYDLFAWKSAEGFRCWLTRLRRQPKSDLFADHRVLIRSFGGIVERSNEPSGTWLLNQNEALTDKEASHDATFLGDYAWAFSGGRIPIDTRVHYSVAREANGNDTLCNRDTGEILLFAPDHSFSHVVALEGCPPFTLYRLPEAPRFRDWVETVAEQWR
jgi:hypothetical protein